jgi:hypothetical protein
VKRQCRAAIPAVWESRGALRAWRSTTWSALSDGAQAPLEERVNPLYELFSSQPMTWSQLLKTCAEKGRLISTGDVLWEDTALRNETVGPRTASRERLPRERPLYRHGHDLSIRSAYATLFQPRLDWRMACKGATMHLLLRPYIQRDNIQQRGVEPEGKATNRQPGRGDGLNEGGETRSSND